METLEIIFQLCPNWFKICYKSFNSSPLTSTMLKKNVCNELRKW